MGTGHGNLYKHINALETIRATLYEGKDSCHGRVTRYGKDHEYGTPSEFTLSTPFNEHRTYVIDELNPNHYYLAGNVFPDNPIRVVWRTSAGKIKLQNVAHFKRVWREAKSKGLLFELHTMIERIRDFCRPGEYAILGYDFAPMSFGFAIVNEEEDRRTLHGGLIFHPGSGVDESLSVELTPCWRPRWSIHT